MTSKIEALEEFVEKLLLDHDLEIELESPDKNFTFFYSTNIVAKEIENPDTLTRGYWLLQNNISSIVDAPWDKFDHAKQVKLLTNLIWHAKYIVKGIYRGWRITCPSCHQVTEGKIWRNSPKNCESITSIGKCNGQFNENDKSKIFADITIPSTIS